MQLLLPAAVNWTLIAYARYTLGKHAGRCI